MINYSNYRVDDILPQLRKLPATLKPINLTVETLGQRNANLLTADAILKFLFAELKEINTALSRVFISHSRKNV